MSSICDFILFFCYYGSYMHLLTLIKRIPFLFYATKNPSCLGGIFYIKGVGIRSVGIMKELAVTYSSAA